MGIDIYEDFEEIRVKDVYIVDVFTDPTPVVLLEDTQGKMLPIYIGHLEALSIGNVIKNISPPRPMAHDLMINIFERLEVKIEGVLIDEKIDKIYYARLLLKKDNNVMQFDARPSDCIALALRVGAPIRVRKKVLESSEVEMSRFEGARVINIFG
ncbi:MAG: bifunctional nuclease family protein [Methanosarcina flavescens]|uniref:Bifunctional nuclease family protein n=1 Tax=Methanosarcina flavescens TaxID=1715806 RepID=A0A660HR50_9EURY|nr:bifunctional nuclease family protein [Methanosarcina flavescens]AYK14727.1 bifunctional nuclease family protein [Methanosarcina flavescens]NLK33566.1 bifunctional nuclease family protein [Methanosarcina flavescens]